MNRWKHLGWTYDQSRGITKAFAPDGSQRCGAKRTTANEPCMNYPLPNGRCKFHGGTALSGMATASYQTGRYSKYLPPDLLEKFTRALGDDDLLSTRRDVALVDSRIEDQLEKLQSGESAELWRRLNEAWSELMAVRAANDLSLTNHHIEIVNRIIRRGANDQKSWDNIIGMLSDRTKLVESERKYLVEKGQMVPAEEVMLMLGVVQDIIATHVKDRATLSAIGRELLRLTSPTENEWVFGESRALPSSAGHARPG
jgi:hypothetical protein